MGSSIASTRLFGEISKLIDSTKARVVQKINTSLVLLYWQIGALINTEILNDARAEYGEQIVKQLSHQLHQHYGRGFNHRALFRMIRVAKQYPDMEIVSTLSTLFSWSHFLEISAIDEPLKRQFYTEMCRIEHWSVRELRKKIDSMLYERTAISKQPEKVITEELKELQSKTQFSQNLVFRDPYILDFLNLPTNYSEKTLEGAIIDELCQFLQEIGTDFCFVSRQKRITIDNEDYYIDLLFYHRGLARLIAIEIKLGRFTAAHKGQVELYLKWLNKYERRPGENEPLGLILCSEKRQEHVELLELDKSGIHVAQYLTELPPRELLEDRFKKAIEIAQEKQAQAEQLIQLDKLK